MEACIDADEKGEALKYIPKLTDPRERAEVIFTVLTHLWVFYSEDRKRKVSLWNLAIIWAWK